MRPGETAPLSSPLECLLPGWYWVHGLYFPLLLLTQNALLPPAGPFVCDCIRAFTGETPSGADAFPLLAQPKASWGNKRVQGAAVHR